MRKLNRQECKFFTAGDAGEIAEASSAMFNGKIAGLEISRELGIADVPIPRDWYQKANILNSPPGPLATPDYDSIPEEGITPVFPFAHRKFPVTRVCLCVRKE